MKLPTVLGFNPSQINHRNKVNEKHPESIERISAIRDLLTRTGLIEECEVIEEFPRIDAGDLTQCHCRGYVDKILTKTNCKGQEELNEFCSQYDSVFMSPGSVDAVLDAVSCCRTLAEMCMEGKAKNAFAIVRPPGHHASADKACGFSIFNNVAQAAEAAFNFGADRVLILDFDVHHGNGTQTMFYEDKRVLYCSIHRYEHGKYWPHLEISNFDHIGDNEGRGYNINIPLNEIGCGDADYLAAFWNVIWPAAVEYDPQLVLISAGFDSCTGDPLGEMNLSTDCYSHIVHHCSLLAQGKVLCVLEGGYNHAVSAVGVHRCLRVLLGRPPYRLEQSESPKKSTVESCLRAIRSLKPYWQCFDFYSAPMGLSVYSTDLDNWTFSMPPVEERTNTADIYQSDLLKPQHTCDKESQDLSTVVMFADSEPHFHFVESRHPEKPERVQAIRIALEQEGLLARCKLLEPDFDQQSVLTAIERTHERPHIERLKKAQNMTSEALQQEFERLDSIYLTNESFVCAQSAVSSAIQVTMEVLNGKAKNGFAIIRPPGHHAGLDGPSGFCLLNNVAIATQHAFSSGLANKVLILDWDVHHGNGTQQIFYEDDRVLFISIHRSDDGIFYPVGEPKEFSDVGAGRGKGFTVNIPWSYGHMGNAEYVHAFSKVVMPIAYEFNPDLVMISAGFDAAAGDQLGGYRVTPDCFGFMCRQLSSLANGKVVALLEGGYNLQAIPNCSSAVLKALFGDEQPSFEVEFEEMHEDAWITLRLVLLSQIEFWRCLSDFQVPDVQPYNCASCSISSSSSDEEVDIEQMQPSNSQDVEEFVGALYAVVPLSECPHLTEVQALPSEGIDAKATCETCSIGAEVWVCLTCYKPNCGRNVYGHAVDHSEASNHSMALSLADLSVWCYSCDSYVHNEALIPAKSSAHMAKFGEPMPH